MVINKLSGKPDKMLGVTCDGLASHPGGVSILLVVSCYRNQDKLWWLWATRFVRLNLLSGSVFVYINVIMFYIKVKEDRMSGRQVLKGDAGSDIVHI